MKKLQLALTTVVFILASTATPAAVLSHSYQFQGNLNDSVGSLAIVAEGGTVLANGYAFGKNQGLTLSNALVSGDSYSIAINFNFATLNGWQKIIDFSDRTSDVGFYTLDDKLNFYPVAGGINSLTPTSNAEVVITRDASTSLFTAYLNGIQQLSFTDGGGAIFGGTNKVIHFFEDDFATSQGEAAPGIVNSIRIWDGALTANEVGSVNAVPLPTAIWLFLGGLGFLSAGSKRKQ